MKLLLLLLLITVIAVNGLSIFEDDKEHVEIELHNDLNKTTQTSGDCESNGGACNMNKQCYGRISMEYTCSKEGVCCIDEGEAKSASEMMIQMISNAIILQGMAIQTLKEDQEKLLKNLTTTISKVTNTISNLKIEVEIMKSNLTEAVEVMKSNLTDAVEDMKSNLTEAISHQGVALQIMKSNLSNAISNQGDIENKLHTMNSKMDNMTTKTEGLLSTISGKVEESMNTLVGMVGATAPGASAFTLGTQYFIRFSLALGWIEAQAHCVALGWQLAQPTDPGLLHLYLKQNNWMTFGEGDHWIGARGTGSCYAWLNGTCIPNNSPLWTWTRGSSYSTSYAVDIGKGNYQNNPLEADHIGEKTNFVCEKDQ